MASIFLKDQIKITGKGSSPIQTSNTTNNTNLNADLLDGTHKADLFTNLSNTTNNEISVTIGGTEKKLVVGYATKAGSVINKLSWTDAAGAAQEYNGSVAKSISTLTLTTGSSHTGLKLGSGWVTSLSNQLLLQNNPTIRFGGDSWDWNVWAGLNYTHSSKTIYLGLADGTIFNANTGQTGGTLKLPGVESIVFNNTTPFYNTSSGTTVTTRDANSMTYNGIWYYTSNGPATSLGATTNDGALYSQAYSTSWVGQIAQDYRNGGLYVRGKNNGTWQAWYRVIDSRNMTGLFTNLSNTTNNEISITIGDTTKKLVVGYATNANVTRYMSSPDTRNDVINPSSMTASSTGVRYDFKAKATIGSPGSDNYYGVMSYRPYASNSDWSGGPAHQLAYGASGIYWRTSSGDTTWNAWKKIAFTSDLKDPGNYYWANIRVSSGSNSETSPSFDSMLARRIYANRGASSTDGGISLYSTSDPMTYGIAFRGTGTYGNHGYLSSDWATYFTMNDDTSRGWIFRRGSTNVASIAGNGNTTLGQYIQLSNNSHIVSGRSTDYHYGYSMNLGDSGNSIGIMSGPGGESGGVVVSPDTCVIYNSFDTGWGFDVHDKDLGSDLTIADTRVFGITQTGYYAWSRGGFQKNGYTDAHVLLAGGGAKAISDFALISDYVPKKDDGNFYIHPCPNVSRSIWYKVTFPWAGYTSSSNAWMMTTMDLILGGSYSGGTNGKILLTYYFLKNTSNVWSAGDVRGTGIGQKLIDNGIEIRYQISNPGIFYIKTNNNEYNSFAINNLSANDTAPLFDFKTTKIERISADSVPSSDYSKVPLNFIDTTNGSQTRISDYLSIIKDGGNSAYDATLYVRSYDNNDWGAIIDKSTSYSYGLDIRAGGTYALRVGSGKTRLIGATAIGADVDAAYTLDVRGSARLYSTYPQLRVENSSGGTAETSIYISNGTAGWALGINPWSIGGGVFGIGQYSGTGSSTWRLKIDNSGYVYTSSYLNIGNGNEKNASNPPVVWGLNGTDNFLRTYQTSSLRVAYAASAGNADTVDGYHASGLFTTFDNYNSGTEHSIRAIIGGTSMRVTPYYLGTYSTITFGNSGLQYFNVNLTTRGTATTNGTPTDNWYHIIRMNHANSAGFYVDIATCFNSWDMWYRRIQSGSDKGWARILDNKNTYVSSEKGIINGTTITNVEKWDGYKIWVGSKSNYNSSSKSSTTIYFCTS